MAFTKEDLEALKSELRALSAGQDFIAFQRKLTPGVEHFAGVRVPALRKIAKRLLAGDWRGFLAQNDHSCHELNLLAAILTARGECDDAERMALVAAYVPYIDNWGTCDTLCSDIRIDPDALADWWPFVTRYLDSDREFELRFAVVMLLFHFRTDGYIDRVLDALTRVRHDGYYVQMGVAWALSFCMISHPDICLPIFENGHIQDKFTHNKAIQKCAESFQIPQQTKDHLKSLRRKR